MRNLLLLLYLLSCFITKAQTINFNHFTLEHNLPAQFLMQDSKGYIWIGSDGIFRFDGLTTKRFVHNSKNANSLINNSIKNIAENKDGTIWIGTQRGISHYYPLKDSFEDFTSKDLNNNQPNSAADNIIFCDDDANIWLGNQTGIYLFNKQTRKFKNFSLQQYQQPGKKGGNFITSIIQDKTNKNFLWLTTYNGLVHFNKSTGAAEYFYPDEKQLLITEVFQDWHNRLWICTWGKGLGEFNFSTGTFLFHSFEKDTHYGITNVIVDIKEQKINTDSSVFYTCTSKGLGVFTTGAHKKTQPSLFDSFYINNSTDKKTIGSQPHNILIDKQSTVWIGTGTDISYILHNNQVFKNYNKLGNIYCINEEKNSDGTSHYLIASWYMSGLVDYDETFSHLSYLNILNSLSRTNDSRQINTILKDTSTNITWVATFDGLFAWNRKTNSVKAFKNNSADKTSLPSNHIIALAKDKRNMLWVGMYLKGTAVMNVKDGKCIQLPAALRNVVSQPFTPILFTDKNGYIWIGTGEKLLCINPDDFSFKIYNSIAGEIICITQDKQNNIWIGCTQGLCMLNEKKNHFDLYTMQDGLPNDEILSIGCDVLGNLWICTNEGISNMNMKTKKFINYFTDDGLISNSQYNYITNNSNGEVMIGGNGFLTVFNPLALTISQTPPPVYITSLHILNRNGSNTLLNYPLGTLHLSYNQNYFNVYFTALNLINATANKYAYKLEGLDKNWTPANNITVANYSNLSPGTYTFKVIAANNNGVWNNKGASLTIIVSPPFWQTWWFILLCAIAVGSIIYLFYRYRLNAALRVERLRTRISTDLHDDIGSTLSSISILSDMVMHDAVNGSKAMLHEIKENSVNLMEKMDDIVWSINPRNDSLEKLLLRIKRFAAQLFEAKNIEYEIDISENIHSFKLPMEIRQHLYLMIKEAINNIIKHSQCTQANICIKHLHDNLLIKIYDNGKGFNTSEISYGNGLINLKERASAIQANLVVQSHEITGTEIRIELKIK